MPALSVRSAKTLRTAPAKIPTVVLLGDSITAKNYVQSGIESYYGSDGFWTWAEVFLGQRFRVLNYAGILGQNSTQILQRFDTDVTPWAPNYVVILAGRNDGTSAVTLTIPNLDKMLTKCAAIGATAILCTLPPLNTPGTGQRQADNNTNQWIKRQGLRPGVIVVDWTAAVQDSTGGFIFPTYTPDGTHPSPDGALSMGRIMANCLSNLIPVSSPLVANNDDSACLMANPMMFGTAGTVGTGGTGTCASSWSTAQGGSGDVYVAAKVARTDNYPNLSWQSLQVTTRAVAGASLYQYSNTGATQWTAGDGYYYQAMCEYQLQGPTTGAGNGLYLALVAFNSGFGTLARGRAPLIAGSSALQASAGVMKTPPIQLPAGTAHVQCVVTLDDVGTVYIGRTDVRRVLTGAPYI